MDMPMLGLGTWQLTGKEGIDLIAEAIGLGYRHLDTAQMYGNETEIGQGVRLSGISRDEIFVVTKIHQDRFRDRTALQSARESIDRMGIGPPDLILCHWPPQPVAVAEVMKVLNEIRETGLARAVGLSNFNRLQMREAASLGPVLTNQVEFHPMLDQSALMAIADDLGITLTAYMPIVRGKALALPCVVEIATRTGRDPAEVVLRWVIQQGVAALCNSTKPERLRSHLKALDMPLREADMVAITAETATNKRFSDRKGWSPDWDA